jgi:hypothetical protein
MLCAAVKTRLIRSKFPDLTVPCQPDISGKKTSAITHYQCLPIDENFISSAAGAETSRLQFLKKR